MNDQSKILFDSGLEIEMADRVPNEFPSSMTPHTLIVSPEMKYIHVHNVDNIKILGHANIDALYASTSKITATIPKNATYFSALAESTIPNIISRVGDSGCDVKLYLSRDSNEIPNPSQDDFSLSTPVNFVPNVFCSVCGHVLDNTPHICVAESKKW